MASNELHVLHVYKDVFPPVFGGVEKQIGALRDAMAPEVVSSVIVCARAPSTEIVSIGDGTEVRVAEFGPRLLSAPVAPSLPMWVRRTSADLIHVHMPNPPGELASILGRKGRPIVASYHADIGRQARFSAGYRYLVDACLGRASAIIAGTQRLVETSPFLRRSPAGGVRAPPPRAGPPRGGGVCPPGGWTGFIPAERTFHGTGERRSSSG